MSLNLDYQPEVVVVTENLSREDWLKYRRLGIGGSDCAAIMGVSPFCTKRDLYYDKIGVRPVMDEEESNWVAKEVGHRLENLVAEIFSKKTGLKVFPVRKMFRHPLYPFMLADVDFLLNLRMVPMAYWSARPPIITVRTNGQIIRFRPIISIRAGITWRLSM